MEAENDRLKRKTKDLQEKLSTKTTAKKTVVTHEKGNTLQDKKAKVAKHLRF